MTPFRVVLREREREGKREEENKKKTRYKQCIRRTVKGDIFSSQEALLKKLAIQFIFFCREIEAYNETVINVLDIAGKIKDLRLANVFER